jgi:hypothetical protein
MKTIVKRTCKKQLTLKSIIIRIICAIAVIVGCSIHDFNMVNDTEQESYITFK